MESNFQAFHKYLSPDQTSTFIQSHRKNLMASLENGNFQFVVFRLLVVQMLRVLMESSNAILFFDSSDLSYQRHHEEV